MTPTRSALDRLVPQGREVFAERVWGRTPLHVPAAERGGDSFADLFGLEAADELLTHRGLRSPFLRMAKQGRTLSDSAFTSGGGTGASIGDQVDPDKVRRLFADGTSIVLQALHRTWPPVVTFAQDLAAELGHPTQVNCYITPPANQGFAAHYDVHDVFVLQVHGSKHWTIHPPVLVHPHRDEPWNDRQDQVRAAAEKAALVDTVLHPGDVLYLPRGFLHSARACGETSVHLTIGIHAWTGQHVTNALLAAAGQALRDHPDVRDGLPVGIDLADSEAAGAQVERFREAVVQAVRALDPQMVLAGLADQAATAQRAEPVAPLAQLAAADALGPHTCVRLRRHLQLRLDPSDGGAVATSRIGVVRLGADRADALAHLLDGGQRPVDALPGAPVQAVAELVRVGLVEVVPPAGSTHE